MAVRAVRFYEFASVFGEYGTFHCRTSNARPYKINGTVNYKLIRPSLFKMPGLDHREFGIPGFPGSRFLFFLMHVHPSDAYHAPSDRFHTNKAGLLLNCSLWSGCRK